MKATRALLPVGLAAALLLAGCTADSAPTKDAAGAECLAGGSASKGIKVSGTTGKDLKITSKTPVSATKAERTVLKEGKGKVAKSGESIAVSMTIFNGADGKAMQQVPENSVPFTKDSLAPWAYDGLRCALPGEQTAVVAPYAEVFGSTEASSLGVEGLSEKDSIVVVLNFGKIDETVNGSNSGEPGTLEPDKLLKKAEGEAQKAPKDYPTVTLAANGEPTITIPKDVKPPTKLEYATLIKGGGEKVEAGDRVYVNYRGVIWRTGKEFDSSWKRGEPIPFITSGVIPGFEKALVGQTVGSQVISIVPAEDGGYGAAQLEKMGHEKDDVMVFVLDIVGTVHAK